MKPSSFKLGFALAISGLAIFGYTEVLGEEWTSKFVIESLDHQRG